MDKPYTQLRLSEREEIKKALDRGQSFREVAHLLGRSPSTISREVQTNRTSKGMTSRPGKCGRRGSCKIHDLCEECTAQDMHCARCGVRDCRELCPVYRNQIRCPALDRAPWVCNGCKKNHYGCNRPNRFIYNPSVAHKAADERRRECRRGIDMTPERAHFALSRIKEGLKRGLSPYEISVLYADELRVHPSTIYRWVEAGYGGLANIELERKVGFRPRRKDGPARSTRHSPKRSHGQFLELDEERRDSRSELDCVCGRKVDRQAVLTIYNLPTHVQLGLLLKRHDVEHVKGRLKKLKRTMPEEMFGRWFDCALTDNGEEFCDEDALAEILGEKVDCGELRIHLYYCDPGKAQQKGGCEKNHTELRQILEKGRFIFDDLDEEDLRVLMSHVNSNPRKSLGGKTPFEMLGFIYGSDAAQALFDALGIRQVPRDELVLKPYILDVEREKRGRPKLRRVGEEE